MMMGSRDDGDVEFPVVPPPTKAFQTVATNNEMCTEVGGDRDISEGLLQMLVPMNNHRLVRLTLRYLQNKHSLREFGVCWLCIC